MNVSEPLFASQPEGPAFSVAEQPSYFRVLCERLEDVPWHRTDINDVDYTVGVCSVYYSDGCDHDHLSRSLRFHHTFDVREELTCVGAAVGQQARIGRRPDDVSGCEPDQDLGRLRCPGVTVPYNVGRQPDAEERTEGQEASLGACLGRFGPVSTVSLPWLAFDVPTGSYPARSVYVPTIYEHAGGTGQATSGPLLATNFRVGFNSFGSDFLRGVRQRGSLI